MKQLTDLIIETFEPNNFYKIELGSVYSNDLRTIRCAGRDITLTYHMLIINHGDFGIEIYPIALQPIKIEKT